MKNAIKQEIEDAVNALPLTELHVMLTEARFHKKMGEIQEEAVKARIRQNLSEGVELNIGGGMAAKYQYRSIKEVPVLRAMDIVKDQDQLNLILKVDTKKAESVLDEDTFKELQRELVVMKTTTALVFTGGE